MSKLTDRHYIARRCALDRSERATPSEKVQAAAVLERDESAETTHYTIADVEGNVVAVTYTLNSGFGSGVTAPGLGFLLNNEMDDFAPMPGEPNMYGLIQGEANAVRAGRASALRR